MLWKLSSSRSLGSECGSGYIRLEEIMQDSPKDALPVAAAGIALCWGKDGKALAWYTGTPWYTFAFHT